jgi:hypothetical protein
MTTYYIPSNLYYSIWSAIRIIARSGAIILIALQRIATVLEECYYNGIIHYSLTLRTSAIW